MSNNETVAAIDVGSNSIKLLVGSRGSSTRVIQTEFTETLETRISSGISRKLPSLTEDAIQAGTDAIAELAHLARVYSPVDIQIVATSAVRDALNGHDFVESVLDATGLKIRILSGTEEATLIGKGLRCDPELPSTSKFIQMDIGGGSLELIRFSQGQIENAISLQLGAVRLTERFIENRDTPVGSDIEALIQSHVVSELVKSEFPFAPYEDPLIATGGAFSVTRAVLA
ncbi:MAG TPA: phosphatase, partial [Opitutae bacterium]|nr:phosphatase [Opitutae bacterium]